MRNSVIELETPRLLLRQWKESDYPFFADMSLDPAVAEFLPPFPDKDAAMGFADQLNESLKAKGWGFWAIERRIDAYFIGIVGMHEPGPEFGIPPCVEIGWRLAPQFWGKGYVTEAAGEVLRFGFEQLKLPEILSFTALGNSRSLAVMERLGMKRTAKNFDLLLFPEDSPHREHCIYSITKERWKELQLKD